MRNLSTREWLGVLAAAGWGALCGCLPAPQFTIALLGPPVAYLLLRKHPLLSWQIPVIAGAIASALQDRDPQGSYTEGPVWPVIFLIWSVESLFSVPWPYIFQRISRRDAKKPVTVASAAKMSLGPGVLIFLACGLSIVGFAFMVHPIVGDVSIFHQSFGFLMATAGMTLAVYICRSPKKLGLDQQIDSIFGWLLSLIALTVLPIIIVDLHRGSFPCAPNPNCTQLVPPLQEFLNFVASLEALAVAVWLLRRGMRKRRLHEDNTVRSRA